MKSVIMTRSPLNLVFGTVALLALGGLAGCAGNDTYAYRGPTLGQTQAPNYNYGQQDTNATAPNVPTGPSPEQATVQAASNLDITSFVDPTAMGQLSTNSSGQAANAQFYALQFGRVGAARHWSGDSGQSGEISVGPYVKVNNRDCRDFANITNVGAKSYTRRGTACRGADGRWLVNGVGTATAPTSSPPASGFSTAG